MSKEIENKNKREVDMSKYDKTREALTKMVGEQFDKNINCYDKIIKVLKEENR